MFLSLVAFVTFTWFEFHRFVSLFYFTPHLTLLTVRDRDSDRDSITDHPSQTDPKIDPCWRGTCYQWITHSIWMVSWCTIAVYGISLFFAFCCRFGRVWESALDMVKFESNLTRRKPIKGKIEIRVNEERWRRRIRNGVSGRMRHSKVGEGGERKNKISRQKKNNELVGESCAKM